MKLKIHYESLYQKNPMNNIAVLGTTVYPAHFHPQTEVVYMLDGKCHSKINNHMYTAETNDLLVIPPYSVHSYATSLNAQRSSFLLKNEQLSDPFSALKETAFPYVLQNKTFNREKVLPVFNELLSIETSKEASEKTKNILFNAYSNVLYGRIMEGYEHLLKKANKQFATLSEILLYIDQHYNQKITLESLSSTFGYNKYHFSKFFHSYMSKGIVEHVNEIRIQKFIAIYAENQNQNVLTTAFNVGFDSMPSFYRAFRRYTNSTPQEYFKTHE